MKLYIITYATMLRAHSHVVRGDIHVIHNSESEAIDAANEVLRVRLFKICCKLADKNPSTGKAGQSLKGFYIASIVTRHIDYPHKLVMETVWT